MFVKSARFLKMFGRDDRGVISLEFVIMMPMLFLTFMACHVYFEGYRQSTLNTRAAYTIGDIISRETDALNPAYIDSLQAMFGLLTDTDEETSIRISVLRWDADDDKHYVEWSVTRSLGDPLTDGTVYTIKDQLPVMSDNDRVIVVETVNYYRPDFSIGMADVALENFVVTRPRFAPQVIYDATS